MIKEYCTISQEPFSFELIQDWRAERSAYIQAWQLAFDREGYEERIDWFIGSPLNRTYILKDQSGTVAAAYSLCVNHLMLSGLQYEIAVCNNVFCVPRYQGLNLFVRIGRLALNDAARTLLMAYGFPNRSAMAGHKRVGWSTKNSISEVTVKFSDLRLKRSNHEAANIRKASDIHSNHQRNICSSLSINASRRISATDKAFGIVKSTDYYNWRFFQRPATKDRTYWYLNIEMQSYYFRYITLNLS